MLRTVLHRKGEKYCTHALMTSRKTDKMLDKISDLLLLGSAFSKLRYKEGSCKCIPVFLEHIKMTDKEATCISLSSKRHLCCDLRQLQRLFISLLHCLCYYIM